MLSSIEGIPFIIRFKTPFDDIEAKSNAYRIEGIPFIIRFKTNCKHTFLLSIKTLCIEGIPFIIRFKTMITSIGSGV